jgi:hypothetical protein
MLDAEVNERRDKYASVDAQDDDATGKARALRSSLSGIRQRAGQFAADTHALY